MSKSIVDEIIAACGGSQGNTDVRAEVERFVGELRADGLNDSGIANSVRRYLAARTYAEHVTVAIASARNT